MEIIKIDNLFNICDEIQFEIKDGILTYVNFSLNGENKFKDLKEKITELSLTDLKQIAFDKNLDENSRKIFQKLLENIERCKIKQQIKQQINLIKRKTN